MTPLALIILDGWGIRDEKSDNGIALAKKPNFDRYWKNYPHTSVDASGAAVGLPDGIMGNSEVGHMNIGAGRIVYTGLSQIYHAIENGSFFANQALKVACAAAKNARGALHLMGLLSDGAVHSHQDHLYALLTMAKKEGLKKVYVHCFMDGRDTPPRAGIDYIRQLELRIKDIGIGKIASVSGRYYAMDRDKRWDRIQRAYHVLVGADKTGAKSAGEIVENSYRDGKGDEFIEPKAVLNDDGQPVGVIQSGDAMIFFNFRADRARQMTKMLNEKGPRLSSFVCMAPYDASSGLPVAFTPVYPQKVFAEVLSREGLKQLRIAETEKYAHVTYFFNGGVETVYPGEERLLIPSPREVSTYDQQPEMSAVKITDETVGKIKENRFDVIILNFANSDMVGHTARPKAIIEAVEVVDCCLGRVVDAVLAVGGCALITADHGNAEEMVDENGHPHTAHTTNLVPFIMVSDTLKDKKLQQPPGRLCDIAPTMLKLLGVAQPAEMTGKSLIVPF